MKIYFERSGGITGMRISGTVDTESLPAEEALGIREMLDKASFFDLPEKAQSTEGADQFQYKLVVEDKGRQHSVELSESVAPDSLRPLLRRLTVLARSAPGSSS